MKYICPPSLGYALAVAIIIAMTHDTFICCKLTITCDNSHACMHCTTCTHRFAHLHSNACALTFVILPAMGQNRMRAIAVSGFGREEDLQQTRSAGFELHLIKPITRAQLDDAISRVASAAALTQSMGT